MYAGQLVRPEDSLKLVKTWIRWIDSWNWPVV